MEDDEPIDRSEYLPSPVLGLSEEALVLSVILKGILSDPEQAALLEASDITPEQAATSEEGTVLEQKVSTAEEGTETEPAPATASREQAELPAAELEPNEPEVQEDQDPTDQIEAVAAEEAASEEPVPETIDAEPPEQNLEVKDADGKVDPENPIEDIAAILEQALEGKEEGPVKPSGSEEGDLTAKVSEAEPASSLGEKTAKKETGAEETVTQEEAGEKAEPDSQEPPDTSTEDQVPGRACFPGQRQYWVCSSYE